MTKRQVKCIGWVAAVTATAVCAAPQAQAASRHVVRPGESIQQAVDAASPGDTVVVAPGTYRGSVRISTPRVTLRGSGTATRIVPGPAAAGDSCGAAGDGVCVTGAAGGSVDGVVLRSLEISGFPRNGVWASRTDRLEVRGVTVRDNGRWGIALERSVRSSVRGNTARDNVDSGVFVADSVDREVGSLDTLGTVIRGNDLTGNSIGVTIRRVRNLTARQNTMSGNCGGLFVVGDESTPRTGALTVRNNVVTGNNKYCAANGRLPHIQGAGIVLTGVADTAVRNNVVRDNVGASPLSGGIVLFPSFVGARNDRNEVRGNVADGNQPEDLADRDTGTGNRFVHNICRVSLPAGSC